MRILADRYELVEKIGEGGMSVVWRAHDARLEREVAVKLLRPFVAGEPDRRSRLAREARTLAALSNDHIVRVYDYAEAGEDAFLVMEFIEGCNLARATFHRLPVPWSEAASYARPVCDALAYAHAKGVIHRDLTPANVLIERDTGRVVTTDFGLARIARSGGSATTIGVLLGTPEYWSPEQAMGRAQRRSDRHVRARLHPLLAVERQSAVRGGRSARDGTASCARGSAVARRTLAGHPEFGRRVGRLVARSRPVAEALCSHGRFRDRRVVMARGIPSPHR